MDKFYNEIKEYGDVLLGEHTLIKPEPVDIALEKEYGLYWINDFKLYYKVGNKGTVIMSYDNFQLLEEKGLLKSNINVLVSKNPRMTYSKVIYDLYPNLITDDVLTNFSNESNISGNNVMVGSNVLIGHGVKIGNNVTIHHNVTIGNNVVIGDNVILGSKGVAYDEDSDGSLIRFPQIGGLVIGDNVEIGSFCDIKRGALKNTIISDGVKIGAFNNIGHNVFIGKNTFISARCNISGSSKIGENCTLWVNSTIKHKVRIPNRTVIGSNSYVNKSYTNENMTLIGIPAKPYKN